MEWIFADARDRLDELFTKATTEGPKTIRHDGQAVIVLAEPTYRALLGDRKTSLKDWLMNGPRTDGLELPPRDQSPMRKVEL